MKKKTKQVKEFLEDLHEFILKDPQRRKYTVDKNEIAIQAEIRPRIIKYLELYFQKLGYKDFEAKANSSFYWEGQEGIYGKQRKTTFGSRNYPDFIIEEPYLIAIEYKQSEFGSTIKQGIGQSIIHTLSGDFDYVYFLFHDETESKKIQASLNNSTERSIIYQMWENYNVFIKFI